MRILRIMDPETGGGRRRTDEVFLPVQPFGPSRHELYRQLLVARDWTAIWAVCAALGWLTVLVLVLL